jgi:hypothetical protein
LDKSLPLLPNVYHGFRRLDLFGIQGICDYKLHKEKEATAASIVMHDKKGSILPENSERKRNIDHCIRCKKSCIRS